jgi:1,4-dihydroxy-2-naphthoyl-CoA synthase
MGEHAVSPEHTKDLPMTLPRKVNEMPDSVIYEQQGKIVTIRINRPAVHNAVNGEAAAALHDA